MPSNLYPHVRDYLAVRGWTYDVAVGAWLVPTGERHADDSEAFKWYLRARRVDRAEGRAM